jgi:anti-anti-sigma regulatory factor
VKIHALKEVRDCCNVKRRFSSFIYIKFLINEFAHTLRFRKLTLMRKSMNSNLQILEELLGKIHLLENTLVRDLPAANCEGIYYYDFRDIEYLNNSDLAQLIHVLKSLLHKGADVRLMNVNKKIRNKINEMGLRSIINCI